MSFFRKASEATYTEPEMHTPPPMYKIVAAVSPSGFCGYNLMKLCEEFIPVFGGGAAINYYYTWVAFNEDRTVLEQAMAHLIQADGK